MLCARWHHIKRPLMSGALRDDFHYDLPGIFRQIRPELDKLSQFGIIAQRLGQASGQVSIRVCCKLFVSKYFKIVPEGFDSPRGYSSLARNAVLGVSWPFLCLWLSTDISGF